MLFDFSRTPFFSNDVSFVELYVYKFQYTGTYKERKANYNLSELFCVVKI